MGLQSKILRLFPKYRRQEQELSAKRRELAAANKLAKVAPTPAAAGSSTPRYLVAKSSTVGIGNRLLFLAGCLFIGRETGRRVLVDWRDGMFGERSENSFWSFFEESDALQVREFGFLDEAPPADFTHPEWAGHLGQDVTTRCQEHTGIPWPPGTNYGPQLAATGWKYNGFFGADLPQRILVTFGGKSRLTEFSSRRLQAQFPGLDAEGVIAHLLRTELRPGPELRRRQHEFAAAQFQGRHVLGVHLRNTDKTPTRPVEELLAQAVELAGGDSAVFLATDHEPTQDLFRDVFGDRLLVVPKWFDPSAAALHYSKSADAAQKRALGFEALLDMYLLARCDRLFLQKNSTFSRIAAYLAPLPAAEVHWHSDDVATPWEP